jgi:hypothetical protein
METIFGCSFNQVSLDVDQEAQHLWTHALQVLCGPLPRPTPQKTRVWTCHERQIQDPAKKIGLPCEDATGQAALDMAVKALTCSMQAAPKDPIYLLSNSNHLMRDVTIELQDKKFIKAN